MKYLIYTYMIASYCYGQYYWPVTNVLTRKCNGTFGEYRWNTNPIYRHFHEGIDIYPVSSSNEVISTWWGGYEVEKISTLGPEYGYAVTVQHYNFTVAGTETTWIEQNHGSRYLHMYTNPDLHLDVGKKYSDDVYIIENSSFYNNHLHFEIRSPAPAGDDYQNAYNPMKIHENLCPDDDATQPTLITLYVDGSTEQSNHHQGDAIITCWNFLDYNFTSYYDATSVEPFVKLTLPAETRDNDLDDPHIELSGNCKARFIIKAKDVINVSGSTCAPYQLALYINTQLTFYDENPVETDVDPYYLVVFDQFLESNDEKHDEEDVYHIDIPLISDHDPANFYYRLYPYDRNEDNNLPSCILSGNSTLKTEVLWEGHHRIRIVAEDITGNIKTGDVHFYIRRNDWVDYCRGFTD